MLNAKKEKEKKEKAKWYKDMFKSEDANGKKTTRKEPSFSHKRDIYYLHKNTFLILYKAITSRNQVVI